MATIPAILSRPIAIIKAGERAGAQVPAFSFAAVDNFFITRGWC
jgi:hypothetical protein